MASSAIWVAAVWSWCACGAVNWRARVLPLGVLRLAALRAGGELEKQVVRAIDKAGWTGRGRGCPSISSAARGARSHGWT
jgi:hypothetical protein